MGTGSLDHTRPDPTFPEGSDILLSPHDCPKGVAGEATPQERGDPHTLP